VNDVVLDANSVAQVITYVAPGFLARLGYRARYPGADAPPGEVLIISVAASLPLVAVVRALWTGTPKPTEVGYVAVLLALGFLIGYALALIRGRPRTKLLLAALDYRLEPEGTIYAQLLRPMSDAGTVLIELKDGRRLWGCPRSGPQYKDDGINELYLAYPQASADGDEWVSAGAGMIVPLSEVSTICLSEDPTGAPVAAAADLTP
jgi:hypothetical protein